MAAIGFKYLLTYNDVVVPLEKKALDVRDIQNLAEGDSEGQEFLTLPLKANANVRWLEKALNEKAGWWKKKHAFFPLVLQVREAIKANKSSSGRLLMKDMEWLEVHAEEALQSSKYRSHDVDDAEMDYVKASFEKLRKHENCASACFRPSRNSFMIAKKDKSCSEFIVTSLNKKRKAIEQRGWDEMETQFEMALSEALVFLEEC